MDVKLEQAVATIRRLRDCVAVSLQKLSQGLAEIVLGFDEKYGDFHVHSTSNRIGWSTCAPCGREAGGFRNREVRLAARRQGSLDGPLPAGRPDVVFLEPRGDVLGFDG
jgi:hypothetical protein